MTGPEVLIKQLEHLLNFHGKNLTPREFLRILSPFISKEMDLRREKTLLQDNKDKVRRLYYFSAEYLTGRLLNQNILALGIREEVVRMAADHNLDLTQILEEEADPGLGNGGLGRLASCFMDSLVHLDLPATGYGICYRFGLFRQEIKDHRQIELADDWQNDDHWGTEDRNTRYTIPLGGSVDISCTDRGELKFHLKPAREFIAIPVDYPVSSTNSDRVHPLRLWKAESPEGFHLDRFNKEFHSEAWASINEAASLTAVLYPGDQGERGKKLRLKQQYFFVSASLQDMMASYRKNHGNSWNDFPDTAVIQLNDTHPVLAIPELMRLLLDGEGLTWDEAWNICQRIFAYTNHTVLEEALEKWPVKYIRDLFPRIMLILEEIQRRLEETPHAPRIINNDTVHMAALAAHGSFSINGVAVLHSDLLKQTVLKDWYTLYPERFNNKTNGITHRRWLMQCNPRLSTLINELIGTDWHKDPSKLSKLRGFDDDSVLQRLSEIKSANKADFTRWLKIEKGLIVQPDSLFDFQVKRIHEYKRQLLNLFTVLSLYIDIKAGIPTGSTPHTFFLGGKAAPGYVMAKEIIYFCGRLSETINNDPLCRDRLSLHFLPGYTVSMAEKIFPASELSQQISTAGKEASGTGNMKFMMNGALTLGTHDGANIEIFRAAGEENNFPFGMKTEEAVSCRETYNPGSYLERNEFVQRIINALNQGILGDPSAFRIILDNLLNHDPYLVLPEIESHSRAVRNAELQYDDKKIWNRKSLQNIAASGIFSSDRTIAEYAAEIWRLTPR
ncbi:MULTISPECIES: glycogen/starch/alpha-glucan phosphorylase [unclassified Oceanispirochaeta]|uniref:glycogen/starch/alpha-glucan phosphorylase n=1 Tax=unclassified Oceanispirochaeta TaxID=2635722 RepID=UPI000E08D135|nr:MULTISPECIES: glycogen/starch/alpha-glucan phosphorylase [unclassified Oceanispirochaeta]MBF9014592.1 glycogen/starch/alpha-glucan phosphorylase [Oceanispirochaeta sp. M2]NPD70848.1 glycogen/starch/alpha-glucan phosphorylase [Oceanispirochaeta sp. M1]RDG34129.1 glycogen/starch/alpha-glucan family phosphorylase [Oceanispirochaeta sp. M1]